MATPAPFSDVPSALDDRRGHPRVAMALPAFLRVGEERHSVQLLDLSCGGAKLNCAVQCPVGADVIVECGTIARPAVVRWQNDQLMGLGFEIELDEREVAAQVQRSRALAAWKAARDQAAATEDRA